MELLILIPLAFIIFLAVIIDRDIKQRFEHAYQLGDEGYMKYRSLEPLDCYIETPNMTLVKITHLPSKIAVTKYSTSQPKAFDAAIEELEILVAIWKSEKWGGQ